jgi:hypothetical protein
MIPQQIKAMKLALEALEACNIYGELECVMTPDSAIYLHPAITAIKEALAEHAMQEVQRLGQEIEQEPVGMVKDLFTSTAWERLDLRGSTKVYLATPPQRTEQEMDELQSLRQFRDAAFLAHPNIDLDIEAAHGIKENT